MRINRPTCQVAPCSEGDDAIDALREGEAFGRKGVYAFKTGEEFFRRTGRWHRLERVLDRRANRYFEHIEDAETGDEVRHVEEPLSKHQGRGDARRRRPR